MPRLNDLQVQVTEKLDRVFKRYFDAAFASSPESHQRLKQAIEYALFSGGKRFRPVLACAVAHAVGEDIDTVIPWAASVEMIHTYSLIHDDLPCMDNDDLRRGQPTTHKKFDEATALLAGDALLTEAFMFLTSQLRNMPEKSGLMVALLAQAAGVRGMIGGQIADLYMHQKPPTLAEIEQLHLQKTGALIQVAAQGAAVLSEGSDEQIELAAQLGRSLGLAFQIADDLLDYDKNDLEPGSYPALLGVLRAQTYLREVTEQAFGFARKLEGDKGMLVELVDFNLRREV